MSRRLQENIVALVVIGFFAFELYLSSGFSPRARLVPVPIAALGIILATIQLIWQNLRSESELSIDLLEFLTKKDQVPGTQKESEDAVSADAQKAKEEKTGHRIIVALGLVVGFVAMILLVGPIPSIFIFTAAYFILSKHYGTAKGLFYALLFTGSVYALFVIALDLQLYHGVLQPILDWYYETF